MRKGTDFADVTLISEDKVKFSSHKVLLSSCSNMFKLILNENIHANPLLYLGGVSSQIIGLILDYIYYGEVNIYQEQLDSFFESAQKLEISGLIGSINETKDEDLHFGINPTHVPNMHIMLKVEKMFISDDTSSILVTTSDTNVVKQRRQNPKLTTNDDTMIYVGSMTPYEIEAKTKELYEKIEN